MSLHDRFAKLTDSQQRHVHGLMLCMVVYLVHYTIYSFWFIEDAAISFAFARNAVLGEGFVAFPGGERVEGFSNPSWTLLMAFFDVFGVNPWVSSKLMGGVFGLLTLPVAWAWTLRAMDRPDAPAIDRLWPLLAPLILATSPQFVLWNASGLENSLFNLFLALGAWSTLRESQEGTAPVSALAWAGLAMTRPEAPLYAAVAGILGFGFVLARQGAKRAVTWAVVWNLLFAATFGVWFLWRYLYFGWRFPNTYYAKVADEIATKPVKLEGRRAEWMTAWLDSTESGWYFYRKFVYWDGKGWKYLRNYALFTAHGFLVPVYALGQTGIMGRRGTAGIVACLGGVILVAPALTLGAGGVVEPWAWGALRVYSLALLVVVLPLIGVGRAGHPARVLAWFLAAVSVFFVLYSDGDWMRGFRWLAMPSVPMAVLFADGAAMINDEIYDPEHLEGLERNAKRMGRRGRVWLAATMLLMRDQTTRWLPRGIAAYPVIAGIIVAFVWLGRPETSPYDVNRRVAYMQSAADRLHLDHVKLLEVDMGAHMWWSGFQLVDIAGLIDVPMAHHQWQKPFVNQYVYEEQRPDFAHVHPSGGWGSRTKMRQHDGWREFIEIPAYPISPRMQHVGNNVRRDLFATKVWGGTPGRDARFGRVDGEQREVVATMVGWEMPAPQVVAGQELFVEVGLQKGRTGKPFRMHVLLTDGERLHVWELPPAYDWLEIKRWRRDIIRNRHSLSVPADWPDGSYDLGFAVTGTADDPRAYPATHPHDQPVFAKGEVRWQGAVTLVSEAAATELAEGKMQRASDLGQQGHCEAAELQWQSARRHLARDHAWQGPARESIDEWLSLCFAERAATADSDGAAAQAIASARLWDHWPERTREVAATLADRWEATGDQLHADGDDDGAYTHWAWALTADPSRAWVRKRAEAARDRLLLHQEAERDKAEEARKQRQEQRRDKAEELRKKAKNEP